MTSRVVRAWAVGAVCLLGGVGAACGYLDEDLGKTKQQWRRSFGERTASAGVRPTVKRRDPIGCHGGLYAPRTRGGVRSRSEVVPPPPQIRGSASKGFQARRRSFAVFAVVATGGVRTSAVGLRNDDREESGEGN